jgi:hypothetical protein
MLGGGQEAGSVARTARSFLRYNFGDLDRSASRRCAEALHQLAGRARVESPR